MTILHAITEAPPSHLHVEAVRYALEIIAREVKPKTLKRIVASLDHHAARLMPLDANVVRIRDPRPESSEAKARVLASQSIAAIAEMLS